MDCLYWLGRHIVLVLYMYCVSQLKQFNSSNQWMPFERGPTADVRKANIKQTILGICSMFLVFQNLSGTSSKTSLWFCLNQPWTHWFIFCRNDLNQFQSNIQFIFYWRAMVRLVFHVLGARRVEEWRAVWIMLDPIGMVIKLLRVPCNFWEK